jgi:hypothetical protein
MNTLMFYSEVKNKLGYIWLLKPPSKREVKQTMKYVNTISEVIGNGYSLYKTGGLMKTDEKNEKNKKKSKKLFSKSSNIKMGKRYKYFCSLYDLMIISREEKREKRRAKMRSKMDAYRHKMAEEEDLQEETTMKNFGYNRCKVCKHYVAPDKMLEGIASSALKIANESKNFNPEQIVELQKLIMNLGNRKPVEAEKFEKYKFIFNKVTVKCGNCDNVFSNAQCVECNGSVMFSVEAVIELQQKHIDLIRANNRTLLEFEHDCS